MTKAKLFKFYYSFERLNPIMTNTICRFLATPSPVFELRTEKSKETVSVQQYAIVRLAQCVQVREKLNLKFRFGFCTLKLTIS